MVVITLQTVGYPVVDAVSDTDFQFNKFLSFEYLVFKRFPFSYVKYLYS